MWFWLVNHFMVLCLWLKVIFKVKRSKLWSNSWKGGAIIFSRNTNIIVVAIRLISYFWLDKMFLFLPIVLGGGPRIVVSTAAFHDRVRGPVPGLGGLKETKMFLPHPRVKVSTVGSLRDREVACSASDRQGSNFESCVWRTVSSQSSHYPQEVLLAQFSLYVHKGGLKPDSFHFLSSLNALPSLWNDTRGSLTSSNRPSTLYHHHHLIIIRRFSWPSLAYMCTKVA